MFRKERNDSGDVLALIPGSRILHRGVVYAMSSSVALAAPLPWGGSCSIVVVIIVIVTNTTTTTSSTLNFHCHQNTRPQEQPGQPKIAKQSSSGLYHNKISACTCHHIRAHEPVPKLPHQKLKIPDRALTNPSATSLWIACPGW